MGYSHRDYSSHGTRIKLNKGTVYPSGVLSPYKFSRRPIGSEDVSIKITHCEFAMLMLFGRGICMEIQCILWHEIAGVVREVGSNVQSLQVQCEKGAVSTFNGIDVDGTVTKGGYSSFIVVHERYCFKIPNNYPLASAAPLLCAGITVYSPMMRHNMNQPGKSLGVIGLGDKFVISSDQEQMKGLSKSLDFIVDTASGDHSFDPYMSLLKTAGIYALLGSQVKSNSALQALIWV
ncbi:hypothetical protein V6N12_073210 [Hibiscus sabdariffa]|uniref:Alcohol dehydrogenase-like N-terminal domain-containing protein n=1 Tax=Hibiscus sabdariffa TaxID=183260 RepID=A0ABR2B7G0_9ROSI